MDESVDIAIDTQYMQAYEDEKADTQQADQQKDAEPNQQEQ